MRGGLRADMHPLESVFLTFADSYSEWEDLMQAPIPRAALWCVNKRLTPDG